MQEGRVVVTVVNRTRFAVEDTMLSVLVRDASDERAGESWLPLHSSVLAPHASVRVELMAAAPSVWRGLVVSAQGLTW